MQQLNRSTFTFKTINRQTVTSAVVNTFANMPSGVCLSHGAIAKVLGFDYKADNNHYFNLQKHLQYLVKKGVLSELTEGGFRACRSYSLKSNYNVGW